jgi:CheY-like chemotaxis protein
LIHPQTGNMSIPAASPPRGTTVMVVDDEAFMRILCRRMLEAEGYRVREAADGLDAIAALLEHGPVDAVITDLQMPNMDGLALATYLASQSPRIPILLMSGFDQHHDKVRALGPVLLKPFGSAQLVEGLRRVLGTQAQSA